MIEWKKSVQETFQFEDRNRKSFTLGFSNFNYANRRPMLPQYIFKDVSFLTKNYWQSSSRKWGAFFVWINRGIQKKYPNLIPTLSGEYLFHCWSHAQKTIIGVALYLHLLLRRKYRWVTKKTKVDHCMLPRKPYLICLESQIDHFIPLLKYNYFTLRYTNSGLGYSILLLQWTVDRGLY